jgi:hypothetical protein
MIIFTNQHRTEASRIEEETRSVPVHLYTEPAGMIPLKHISIKLDENGDLSLHALDKELRTSGVKVIYLNQSKCEQN